MVKYRPDAKFCQAANLFAGGPALSATAGKVFTRLLVVIFVVTRVLFHDHIMVAPWIASIHAQIHTGPETDAVRNVCP
jgi:hypothetical protein